jgi:hypothetical protein
MLSQTRMKQELPIDIWQGRVSNFLTLRQLLGLRRVSREWKSVFAECFERIYKQRIHVQYSRLIYDDAYLIQGLYLYAKRLKIKIILDLYVGTSYEKDEYTN